MVYNHVAFQVVHEVKLHFSQLRVIRGKGLDSIGLAEQGFRFGDDILDMYRRLFGFGCDVDTRRDDIERIRLAVGILQIKSSKKHCRSGDNSLPQTQFLPQLCYHIGEEDGQKIQMIRVVDILDVFRPRMPKCCAVDYPSFTY